MSMSINNNGNLLDRISTVEALVNAITKSILDDEIEPGTQLKETDLARKYNVSRHSVREAILLLVNDGLLHKEINRGVTIPLLTANDIQDLYSTRALFEVVAVKSLCEKGEVPEQMVKCMKALEVLDEGCSWHEIIEIDVDFHTSLVDSLHSQRIINMYKSLLAEFKLCVKQSRRRNYITIEAIQAKHRTILDAIMERDAEKAQSLVRKHLEDSAQEHIG